MYFTIIKAQKRITFQLCFAIADTYAHLYILHCSHYRIVQEYFFVCKNALFLS